MNRIVKLKLIYMLYAIFCVWHLCWARFCLSTGMDRDLMIALSHDTPNLLSAWFIISVSTGSKLQREETRIRNWIVTLILFYHVYITLASFSSMAWVFSHNILTGIIVGIFILFSIFTIYNSNSEDRCLYK